jgi:hypothetical protein
MSSSELASDQDDPATSPDQVEGGSLDGEAAPVVAPSGRRQTKGWYRLALVLTLILIIGVLIALPLAVRSMYGTVFGSTENPYYDLETGQVLTTSEVDAEQPDRTYMNIAVTDIAEDAGTAAITVSGHRTCTGDCPELDLLLLALDESATRRGTAPSANLQVLEAVEVFTEDVDLPIDGNPSLYPFDVYTIQLAVAGFSVDPAGTPTPLTPENFGDNLTVAVQNQIAGLLMEDPVAIALPELDDADNLIPAVAGRQLSFTRPIYLQVLTALLVLLIGISGLLALLTRSIDDLLLGIGGLILGVWGIRSVMVPQPLPTLSLVDMSLSAVILFLLFGLAIRTAIHFHQKSELPSLRDWLRRR